MNIAKQLYQHLESNQEDSRRPHLGASLIGHACARHIWYAFRWAKNVTHEGRILRIFQTGKLSEQRIIDELRAAGIDVGGQQDGFAAFGGHFSGSVDGIIGDAVLEVKTHNAKSFAKLEREGIPARHLAQLVVYIHAVGKARGIYLAICKDTDAVTTLPVDADPELAESLFAKAKAIIFAPVPPEKLSSDPAFYVCRMCPFSGICHGAERPERNCRTCYCSTPQPAGGWTCDNGKGAITFLEQKWGCGAHRYLPPLIGAVEDACESGAWVQYQNGWIDDGEN